jgi:hypothetical protein
LRQSGYERATARIPANSNALPIAETTARIAVKKTGLDSAQRTAIMKTNARTAERQTDLGFAQATWRRFAKPIWTGFAKPIGSARG